MIPNNDIYRNKFYGKISQSAKMWRLKVVLRYLCLYDETMFEQKLECLLKTDICDEQVNTVSYINVNMHKIFYRRKIGVGFPSWSYIIWAVPWENLQFGQHFQFVLFCSKIIFML